MGRCRTPIYMVRASKFGPGPPRVRTGPLEWVWTSLYGVQATHGGVPSFRTEHTRALIRAQAGVRASHGGVPGSRTEHTRALIRAQAGVRCRHVSRPSLVGSVPNHIYSCSPSRRRPDAATWLTARGISQRAEPGMKPLGYARLCIRYR
jgi:hypothetical protein